MPYVFDAYGTLFDFHAAVSRHHAAAGPDAALFSEVWRLFTTVRTRASTPNR